MGQRRLSIIRARCFFRLAETSRDSLLWHTQSAKRGCLRVHSVLPDLPARFLRLLGERIVIERESGCDHAGSRRSERIPLSGD